MSGGGSLMTRGHGANTGLTRRVLGWMALAPAVVLQPLQASDRSIYELSYPSRHGGTPGVESFAGAEDLRPGFLNDIQRGRDTNVEVRSTRLLSMTAPDFSGDGLETSGAYARRFGSSGFGYGVDLSLGLRSFDSTGGLAPGEQHGVPGRFVLTDFSTGPTYQAGNLQSQVRIGMRYPLVTDQDSASPLYSQRGDYPRGAGYLSLDSRLRISDQGSIAVSVYYDDYRLVAPNEWLGDRLDFQSGTGATGSVIGFEMGLNF